MNRIIISDIHIGDKRLDERYLRAFVNYLGYVDELILAGDILDSWVTNKWDLDLLYFIVHKSARVIFIKGNHDPENLESIIGFKVLESYEFETPKGKYLVFHGHQFDYLMAKYSWWAKLSFKLHQFLYSKFNIDLQKIKNLSLARRSKAWYFKNIINDSITEIYKKYSKDYKVVICGHTHYPIRVKREDFEYVNSGDLFENFTYVKIDKEGNLDLCGFYPPIRS